ncbi:hypothetical protein ELQ35_20870 [Peribacillus cavernae]|uniref:Uncharacterized protein n=1 Tax=Peribacillus cavernae TaxID=1674310 RepID=A0A3S0V7I5_9BACI|nr:hypothetical protein [Peribacillus cavernae]MDQ0221249.1 hypothetical protein [Peribacillus cavernae]RUQ25121.1 hypothetical protein ELQ35_20870 [Peribacillus cavernae]
MKSEELLTKGMIKYYTEPKAKFISGADWSERTVGTYAIGTLLRTEPTCSNIFSRAFLYRLFNFNINQLQNTESYQNMQKKKDEIDWTAIPVTSTPSILFDATAPVSSYGNSFGTLAEGVALTETAYKVGRYGVNIRKKGDTFLVKNGEYIYIEGKKFHKNHINSQVKLGNDLQVAKYVHPAAAVKDAFKSKIGLLGIGITAGENVYQNIESNASASRVIGDAAVDVGLGAVSLAGGAIAVATAGAVGAPIIAAASVGFGISVIASYLLEGVKFGKKEKSLSEELKDGVQKGVKTVAGWFK